ncbi:isochorismatase family protein [Amycolatopsis sp. NBC_00438]|uniref:isochorismatase family protein n=1 Tax=Amycolatopsis sp. NBC_00438 TaxID=2903558 RepID=UPI002E22FE9F
MTEPRADRYKWTALTNTTAAVFMSALDGSIVLIALPAIFTGVHLDPLAPGNIAYLLWMIMGYRLVQAVLVVTVGRLGDMFGRVRIYNAGFAVFTVASILLSFDPFDGGNGALWLIAWRVLQAVGGSMLTANSAAILTDAFPQEQRGFALGVNQVAGLGGMFIGLVAGGLLAAWDWRAVFWVNVPVGVFFTVWAYRTLRETGKRGGGRIDWWGNVTFAVGLSAVLIAITFGLQPYGGHTMGWTNPLVQWLIAGGLVLLAAFVAIENRVAAPMIQLSLFRLRAFTFGNLAGLAISIGRGGLQFVLIIWLQGIWLPLHGYDYESTPLWAGIFMLPLTAGFLAAGPVSGYLSDRFGSRGLATGGALLFGASFLGLMLLPIDFGYGIFAVLIALNGIAGGMFASPNSSSIMGSVPADLRGVASGMRATFQNSGTAVSIGVFFSLMIAGLASNLPHTLTAGLRQQGVPAGVAGQLGGLPPVSSLSAAQLGVNPIRHLLEPSGALAGLTPLQQQTLTGREFFPSLISGPFHSGLVIVFAFGAALAVLAAIASLLRGTRKPTPTGESTMALTTIDPTSALVVIDLQQGIVAAHHDPAVTAAVKQAAGLATEFRRHGLPVVLVNVTGRAPGRTDAGRSAAPATPPPGWADLVDELDVQPTDHLITKRRRSAFHDTGLDTLLRDLGVTQIVLAGISTSSGVESTARSGSDHGYHVVLATDAMTDPDADAHRHSVEGIFPKLGETATTAEIVGRVEATR